MNNKSIKIKITNIINNKAELIFPDEQKILIDIDKLPANINIGDEFFIVIDKNNHKDFAKNILNSILKPHNS